MPAAGLLALLALLIPLSLPGDATSRPFNQLGFKVNEQGSAENVKTVQIAKRKGGWQNAKAVVSLAHNSKASQLTQFQPGQTIRAASEVQVSVTCLEPMPKCVGKRYSYSPKVRAKIVLARGERGKRGQQIGRVREITCSQRLPNRNHHCLLVLNEQAEVAGDCLCTLNVVLQAYHRKAKRGHKLVIGSDSDSGIKGKKAHIAGAFFEESPPFYKVSEHTSRRKLIRRGKVVRGGSSIQQPTASVRVGELRRGDVLVVDARIRTSIGHLRYNVLHQGEMFLSEKPRRDLRKNVVVHAAANNGRLTKQNGANCTRGRSYLRNPCLIRKVGIIGMERNGRERPMNDKGPFVPLHVVVNTSYKAVFGRSFRSGDRVRIRSVRIKATKYRRPGR